MGAELRRSCADGDAKGMKRFTAKQAVLDTLVLDLGPQSVHAFFPPPLSEASHISSVLRETDVLF